MKYSEILWIYNKDIFDILTNSYFNEMIDVLKNDFTVVDYQNFKFNYNDYEYIIFMTRSLQIVKDYDNPCLDIFFNKLLEHSPQNKIILYIEDYLNTLNFNYPKINYLITKYKDKIKLALSLYPEKYLENIKYINVPFFIPDYKLELKLDKQFDLLLWGAINNSHYPLRKKINDLMLAKSKNKLINIQKLEHTGYTEKTKKHDITGRKLHKLLSHFWFSLCTCEKKNYNCSFVPRKYLECMISGTIPVGDYPNMLNIYTKYNIQMIDVDKLNLMNLDKILALYLKNKNKLIEIIMHNYKIAKDFTFDKQNEYFYRIIFEL